jgi:hypothetical protein
VLTITRAASRATFKESGILLYTYDVKQRAAPRGGALTLWRKALNDTRGKRAARVNSLNGIVNTFLLFRVFFMGLPQTGEKSRVRGLFTL